MSDDFRPACLSSPTLTADDYDISAVRVALDEHGHFVMRRTFDPAMVDLWKEEVASDFDAMDRTYRSGQMDEVSTSGYMNGAVGLQPLLNKFNITRHLAGGPVGRLALDMFNGSAFCLEIASATRRAEPDKPLRLIRLHCDIQAEELVKNRITTWVPLTHSGKSAPGIEFLSPEFFNKGNVIEDIPELLLGYTFDPGEESSAYESELRKRRRCDREFYEKFGSFLYRPVLDPGDILVFGPDIYHRGVILPGMNETRYSFDVRWSESFNAPDDCQGFPFGRDAHL